MTTSCRAAKAVPVRLLHLHNIPIFRQLQIEEALLRADTGNWCLINSGSSPAIVMGISGKPEQLIDREAVERRPVPLIRRFSGGGTVFIDPDTVFATWIFNAPDAGAECFPDRVHRWAADFYHDAFPSIGMAFRENDYVIGERKWGGNAQYLTKGRWLHHTSILWDYTPEGMKYLLQPAKAPAYRRERHHTEFLTNLREHFPEKRALVNAIRNNAETRFDVAEATLDEVEKILCRPHRTSTHFIVNGI